MRDSPVQDAAMEIASFLPIGGLGQRTLSGEIVKALNSAIAAEREEILLLLKEMHDDSWGMIEEQSALERAMSEIRKRDQKNG